MEKLLLNIVFRTLTPKTTPLLPVPKQKNATTQRIPEKKTYLMDQETTGKATRGSLQILILGDSYTRNLGVFLKEKLYL